MEVLLFEHIQFPLSVPVHVGSRASTVRETPTDPLFSEYREKRGEERGYKAGIEQRLNCDGLGRRAGSDDRVEVCVRKEGTEGVLVRTLLRC